MGWLKEIFHVGISGNIQSPISVCPANKPQYVITVWEKTAQPTIKVIENTLTKNEKLKIETETK